MTKWDWGLRAASGLKAAKFSTQGTPGRGALWRPQAVRAFNLLPDRYNTRMASEDLCLDERNAAAPTTTPEAAQPDGNDEPPLLRFGLRRLFVLITLTCGFLAAMTALDVAWAMCLALVVVLIAVHVMSTVVGNQLRDGSTRRIAAATQAAGTDEQPTADAGPKIAPDLPPASPLYLYEFGRRRVLWVAAIGAGLGGTLGGSILAWSILHRISLAGWLVGTISAAVLGAWLSLLFASFWYITRRTWREAVQHHSASQQRR